MKQYFSFQWHITDECDQRCKHCYIFSEDNCKKLDQMTWKQMKETFYNCLDFCKVYHRLPYFLYYRRRSDSSSGFLETSGTDEGERDSIYHSGKSVSFK